MADNQSSLDGKRMRSIKAMPGRQKAAKVILTPNYFCGFEPEFWPIRAEKHAGLALKNTRAYPERRVQQSPTGQTSSKVEQKQQI
ncbi:hypothetical protein PSQ40_06045 [Curvibacter sp. HBC61]|uniref:Uncharacterized protein n=1 Tax=Curvibacter cyanobacteriorum TaxID=3026422 RepID=A0ABT5MVP2_9BURK|nr:hypothetical protein [Curvibacter sp. HBC61]MDD0838128.1 hypothetical protein [Curvibacter sp. HBC61]